ncbi:MAG: DUF3293 domain-containing protein [Gammaproteobacteria bacterium]|nr:DUF3293 domain-containing protein [Gammaproteobacteria bacterium]
MPRHRPSAALTEAFQQTRYLVAHAEGSLTVRVGQPPPAPLQECSWLVITADNPQAQQLAEHDNGRRRAALRDALQQLALPMLPTRHVDAKGQWPDEHGWLVLLDPPATQTGLDTQLLELGRQFGQLALLVCEHASEDSKSPAVVRLLWLYE